VKREQRQVVEAAAAAVAAAVVRCLPRRLVLAAGRRLGRLWGALDGRHRAITEDNLRRAFPEWDEQRVARTARAVYAHFGCMLLDILWMAGRPVQELLALADIEGVEHLRAGAAQGRGILCPSAHLGNWELHGVATGLLMGPIGVIARPLDNPALDRRLVAFRSAGGNQVIYKQRALAQVLKLLRGGGTVAVLVDQNVMENDGIFVRFFGRPAATTTVAAALALKTGCALVAGHCWLQPNGRYHMSYEPVVGWGRSGRQDEDVAALTQRLTTVIEGWVRQHPQQWLWLHRRWKTQPSAAATAASVTGGAAAEGPVATTGDAEGEEAAPAIAASTTPATDEKP
jgi:KDO2-lipid IV(A) lauroyltransferase